MTTDWTRTTWVKVRFDYPGLHMWPDAPASQYYLGLDHRHMFQLTASMTVEHDDREVEFHALREELDEVVNTMARVAPPGLESKLFYFGALSCESMAEVVITWMRECYPGREYKVEVSEDGENAAIIEEGIVESDKVTIT